MRPVSCLRCHGELPSERSYQFGDQSLGPSPHISVFSCTLVSGRPLVRLGVDAALAIPKTERAAINGSDRTPTVHGWRGPVLDRLMKLLEHRLQR